MAERAFIPGSKWLYFKLYTGHKSADDILISFIRPFVRELTKRGDLEHFFFIRYSDPEFHLRLRLMIPAPIFYESVFCDFYKTFQVCIENDKISKIQCDTYQRELERYGNLTIEVAERMFSVDSIFILELLAGMIQSEIPDKDTERWRISFRLVDDLLEAFLFTPESKTEIMSKLADSYKKEFNFARNVFTKQLNDKYRALRSQITETFNNYSYPNLNDLLKSRRDRIMPYAAEVLELERTGQLEIPLHNFVTSLIHMTMNRWFKSKNRVYELVIYDFLSRYYKSQEARIRYAHGGKIVVPPTL